MTSSSHIPVTATLQSRTLFDDALSDPENLNLWVRSPKRFTQRAPSNHSEQVGAPHSSLLPTDLVAEAAADRLQDSLAWTTLQYGPAIGEGEFLESLAEFLSRQYDDTVHTYVSVRYLRYRKRFKADAIHRSNLAVSSGASQSFSNLLTWFTTTETRILVEDPTYFLAMKVLNDHGVAKDRIVSIPTDQDGLDLDMLEKWLMDHTEPRVGLRTHDSLPRFPFILYTVPIYSNPTGRCLSTERMQKLVKLSERYHILVICDDVYPFLNFTSAKPKRVFSFSNREQGYIVSNGSFSKILGPGARCGWIEASQSIIKSIQDSGLSISGGSAAHFVSTVISRMMSTRSLDAHVERLRKEYFRRRDIMCNALERNLGKHAEFEVPEGGFFVWVKFPDTVDTHVVVEGLKSNNDEFSISGKKIRKQKVMFPYGNIFSVSGSCSNYTRLCFTHIDEDKIEESIRRIGELILDIVSSDE